jgi:formate--tetrahydrofolate ligase
VTDISDRSLRHVEIVIDAKKQLRYDSSFDITVASELMAVFCLANNEKELTDRINNIIVGYSTNNQPIKIKNLQITNAIIKLLNNAIWPNAVQSLEANLALIHGGPFANIAHGCNSILAIKTAMHLAEYTITEAGFGSDLGGEKFIDIVCRNARINPNAIVLVASIRSLKMHAGINPKDLAKPNIQALTNGLNNLAAHIKNLNNFGVPIVVAINQFPHDTPAELALLADYCQQQNVAYSFTTLFAKGSFGAIDLAKKVMHATAKHVTARQIYSLNDSLTLKLNKIVTKCYGADKVVFAPAAKQKLRQLNHTKMYVCVAKTPLTFSDDPKQLIPPAHFDIHIQDLIIANGANFIIALAGKIYRMPGLPIVPAATKM